MRIFALAIALGLFASSASAEEVELVPIAELKPAPWTKDLDREIERINRRYSGELAAYVSDPYRGYRYGFNAGKPFYLASGVKIAFMIGIFRAREHDGLTFDEKITFTEKNLRDGGPRSNKIELGTQVSIHTLLDWMMRSSDNAASDILAERADLQAINRGLVDEGLEGFTPLTYLVDVRRGIYRNLDVTADDLTPLEVRTIRWTRIWNPQIAKLNEMLGVPRRTYSKDDLMKAYDRFYATEVNNAPMATVGLVFEKMLRKQLVSAKASEEMLELMTGARTSTHRILGRLPRGTRVAHKTGSQFERLCDLGVVFLPDGKPMIVTACTKGGTVPSSEAAIARIARKAYDLILADHAKKGS
ncbi:MAG: serine hydrolase [Deltaproteobacteria bacterium]